MGMSGQLKCFFDHMAYRWMSHRPHPIMNRKIGVAVSTTAGLGAKKTYRINEALAAMNWNEFKPGKKKRIERKANRLAEKVSRTFRRASAAFRCTD